MPSRTRSKLSGTCSHPSGTTSTAVWDVSAAILCGPKAMFGCNWGRFENPLAATYATPKYFFDRFGRLGTLMNDGILINNTHRQTESERWQSRIRDPTLRRDKSSSRTGLTWTPIGRANTLPALQLRGNYGLTEFTTNLAEAQGGRDLVCRATACLPSSADAANDATFQSSRTGCA